ncbi:MAG: thermostable hemolysin [Steroidobacteraceae bacterium]
MTPDPVPFIQSRYAAVHGATAPVGYSRFMSRMRSAQQGAALGFRRASEGRLFLESYLDAPVEKLLAERLNWQVERARIVEIGSLAANSPQELIRLWCCAAHALVQESDVGIAVLTRRLRVMLRKVGITLHELAPALPGRVSSAGGAWGTYYTNDPVVCAGQLADARRQLARFMSRRRKAGSCA